MNDYLRDRVTAAVGEHYLVEHEVGRGGMAVVYRATDLRLHRPVAIKVLPPDVAFNGDVRTRFIREAQTAAQLSHPNIVPIYSVDDAGETGVVYFVMAFVDGESAGASLAREGAWATDRAVRVLRDVADALAYAHAHGVVHRDIKPDNILIDRASGRPMVTDFGIARAAAGETRLTVTGVAVGTPAYMSPEQALGEREVDGRSDLYSLAVVGYHMLAGQPPFKAANTPAMLVKHVSERPRPIRELRPDLPAYLAVAIDRALAKRPEDRWADAAEFRDALDGGRKSVQYVPPAAPAIVAHDLAAAPMPARLPLPAAAPAPAAYPSPPPGLSRGELKHWYRTQARLAMAEQSVALANQIRDRVTSNIRVGPGAAGGLVIHAGRQNRWWRYDDRPIEYRVVAFRRSVFSWLGWTAVFFGVNVMTHGPGPWFMIPSALLLLNAMRKGASIWSDGVGPLDAFSKGISKRLRAERQKEQPAPSPLGAGVSAAGAPSARTPDQIAGDLATADVLTGPHGTAVLRAAADWAMIRELNGRLGSVEREMIPDIAPTVDALARRVGTLATTLHGLDADVSGTSLGALDQRIASLRTEPDTSERERRLSLLERQRSSLHDLLERRRSLAGQLESAGLMLQNLKLDLIKLRSSGLGTSIEEASTATQEARALSREIGHVIAAADDLRKL